ncbi:beta-galactosidase [Arthrobacter sp. SA17]
MPLAGEHTRVFREVGELGQDLQSLRQLAGTPCKAKIAVLFDWDSWWAAESPDTPTSRLEVLQQIQAYYAPLLRRGLAVEVVHPSADLGRFELVLAPSLFILGQQNAEELGTFVQSGGHLVVGPFSAVADQNGHLVPGRFPGVLAELLGADGEEWLPLASPWALSLAARHRENRHPGTPVSGRRTWRSGMKPRRPWRALARDA